MTMSRERYKILIVDADERSRKFLESNLVKYDYVVIQAATCDQGLELANQHLPDLIITDIFLPLQQGIEFCWLIRETARVSTVPIILLTPTDDPEIHLNGYRNGADAFLLKPVSLLALITRIETLIQRVEQLMQPTIVDEETLNGSLKVFNLLEILQLLSTSRKEGWLHVEHRGIKGVLGIMQGEVVSARVNELEGEEAVVFMAGWEHGQFEFHRDKIAPEANIHKSTMQLILECCAILDVRLNYPAVLP